MYAVFEDGSRQYKVSEGDVVTVDYREAELGARIEFSRVLIYANGGDTKIGQPLVVGSRIVGDVVDHPTIKTYIQKFRRRKNYRRFTGHRQPFIAVKVRNILLAGQEIPAPAPKKEEAPATSSTPS